MFAFERWLSRGALTLGEMGKFHDTLDMLGENQEQVFVGFFIMMVALAEKLPNREFPDFLVKAVSATLRKTADLLEFRESKAKLNRSKGG